MTTKETVSDEGAASRDTTTGGTATTTSLIGAAGAEVVNPFHVGKLRRNEFRVSLATGQRLTMLWQVLGMFAAIVALVATLNPSGDAGLPGAIMFLLLGVHALAIGGYGYAAYGIKQVWRPARSVSIVTNYLVFIVSAAAALHQFGFFTGIGAFGEGLNKAFIPFLVILVGLLWTSIARGIRERAPESRAPGYLQTAGRVVITVGSIWFVIKADPSGMFAAIGSGLTRPLTIGAILVSIGSVAALVHMWQPRVAAHFGTGYSETQLLTGMAFLSPNIIGFLFFFAGPLIFSFVVSFFDWTTTNTTKDFIFLDNYIRALSLDVGSADSGSAGSDALKDGYRVLMNLDWFGQHWVLGARDVEFWLSLRNILIFLLAAVPLSVLPALGLSAILASRLPGMKVFRAIYFVPAVAGVIGVSIIWGQLFQSTVGWINYIILRAGEILPFVDPPAEGQPWLSDSGTALLAIIVVFAWMNFGFNTVLYLAGHQAIPKELYEAAEIDGASTWRTFRRITVPQLKNTTFYVVAVTSILALQLFDIVWVLSTPEPGGPNNATTTPVITLYEEAFKDNNTGYASALAWILFILIFGLTFGQFRRQRDVATTGGSS